MGKFTIYQPNKYAKTGYVKTFTNDPKEYKELLQMGWVSKSDYEIRMNDGEPYKQKNTVKDTVKDTTKVSPTHDAEKETSKSEKNDKGIIPVFKETSNDMIYLGVLSMVTIFIFKAISGVFK